jgi:hypothetical protein
MHLSYPVRTNTIRRVQLLLAQSARTVLMTCHPSPPCLSSRPQPSSSATSTVIPKTLGTPYHGGMTDGPLILAFHAWPWIIWPYLVSVYIIISFPRFTGFHSNINRGRTTIQPRPLSHFTRPQSPRCARLPSTYMLGCLEPPWVD